MKIALVLVLASMPSLAAAQEIRIAGPLAGQPARIRRRPYYESFSSVEITTALGLADVGRAGAGLLPHGYDHEGGPMGTLDVRTMVALSRRFHGGGMARFAHTAGDSFGALSSYGFLHLVFDLGAVARWPLRMSTDARWQGYVITHLGLSGSMDDAGVGGGDPRERSDERLLASRVLDHGSIGFFWGARFDARAGPWIMGVGADVRVHWGIDSPVSRHAMVSIEGHFGVAVDWLHERP